MFVETFIFNLTFSILRKSRTRITREFRIAKYKLGENTRKNLNKRISINFVFACVESEIRSGFDISRSDGNVLIFITKFYLGHVAINL